MGKYITPTYRQRAIGNAEKSGNTALLLALSGAVGLYFLMRDADPVTPEAKESRYIQFDKGYGIGYVPGNGTVPGTKLPEGKIKLTTVRLPMVDYSHYRSHELPQVQAALDEIKRKYGNTILAVEALTKVPFDLIVAMIFIESGGKERAVSGAGAVGLMQLIPDTAVFVVAMENIKKRLSQYETDWLRETIGRRVDYIKEMKNLGTEVVRGGIRGNKFITREDLYNPEFNILCGAIFLGILLDEHKEDASGYRLDKVVVRYNMGYNAMSKGKKLTGSPNQLVAKLSGEPQAYIKKLVGKYGLLTLV